MRVGGAIALLAARGPLAGAITGVAAAQTSGLSPDARRTFRAALEAVCSYDDRRPPHGHGPSVARATEHFAEEYTRQQDAFRQSVDAVLQLLEAGPKTEPPIGVVRRRDLPMYRGRAFSELAVPQRLRFLSSWLSDRNPASLGDAAAALGIDDYGTLHRGAAVAVIQLTAISYYRDPKTWPALGWTGPWLGRDHEGEDLPFSHAEHTVYHVDFGAGRAFDDFGSAA